MKNRTMQEMNEQYKDCPVQVNTYEVDGRTYRVHSHFIGDKDINDVMYRYAEDKAMSKMLGLVPSLNRLKIFPQKVLPLPIYCAIIAISVKVALG